MGKTSEEPPGRHAEAISEQRARFAATAPLDAGGLFVISPNSLESFEILNANTVAYPTSSGAGDGPNQPESNLDSRAGSPARRRD